MPSGTQRHSRLADCEVSTILDDGATKESLTTRYPRGTFARLNVPRISIVLETDRATEKGYKEKDRWFQHRLRFSRFSRRSSSSRVSSRVAA